MTPFSSIDGQRCIQNPVEHLRLSFLEKQLKPAVKIVNRLTVNYFCNKFQLKCSTEFWIRLWIMSLLTKIWARGGSKTAATSKMELFVIIVNGFKPLTIITKSSTLDVSAVLDPPLWTWMILFSFNLWFYCTSTCRWQKKVRYRNIWLIYLLLMWKGAYE